MTKFAQLDFRFFFLGSMLVFLPGVESLKNIFALLFVLSCIFIAKKYNNWGGKWLAIDSIFLFWIIADVVVSINAHLIHQLPASGFRDIFRFVLIAWAISRMHLTAEKFSQLTLIAVIATVVTLT